MPTTQLFNWILVQADLLVPYHDADTIKREACTAISAIQLKSPVPEFCIAFRVGLLDSTQYYTAGADMDYARDVLLTRLGPLSWTSRGLHMEHCAGRRLTARSRRCAR